jgi:hypothetical protein
MKTFLSLFWIVFLCCFAQISTAADILSNIVQLPTGQIVSAATTRFGSWERVRIAEQATRSEEISLEKLKLEKADPAPQIIINTPEALAIHELARMTEIVAASNQAMTGIIIRLTGGEVERSTPMPKGAFAEFIDSVGTAGEKIARTPAVAIVSTGYALGTFMKEVDAGTKVDSGGGDVSIVNEKTNSSARGGSTITNQPNQDNSTITTSADWEESSGA